MDGEKLKTEITHQMNVECNYPVKISITSEHHIPKGFPEQFYKNLKSEMESGHVPQSPYIYVRLWEPIKRGGVDDYYQVDFGLHSYHLQYNIMPYNVDLNGWVRADS